LKKIITKTTMTMKTTDKQLGNGENNIRPVRMLVKGGKVALRARKGKNNIESLFLDYKINGRRCREFIELYLYPVKATLHRDTNKETLRVAESLRAKREITLNSSNTGITPLFRKKVDFIQYMQDFIEKSGSKNFGAISVSKQFSKFIKRESFPCDEFSRDTVIQFKAYLERTLNGGTPLNYFKIIKRIINSAVREGLLRADLTTGISIRGQEGITKEILLMDEVQKLAETECINADH
jgi:hypothetical protein